MSVIAFIPVRGGSKSIPGKNIKIFCGKPLVYWNLLALQQSNLVDEIVVATDCKNVYDTVTKFNFTKVKLYNRSEENAQDHSTSESIMIEYINYACLNPKDIFLLVQATSPFTQSYDFNTGLELMQKYDSVLSCARIKRFIWSNNFSPLNYDYKVRPRRQDFDGVFMENGAFCISTVEDIIKHKNRISGNIGICEMPEHTYVEIDEPDDWIIAENLFLKHHKMQLYNFEKIKLFLSDVDGVLTDAGMYYTENGDEIKKFSTYDGMGFKILQSKGIKVGIITSESRELNKRRAKKLNLDFDFHGAVNKLEIITDLCKEEGIDLSQVAYIGDDLNCLSLLSNVGFPACPSNAVNEIKSIPNILQLSRSGGNGVVREFIDLILQ